MSIFDKLGETATYAARIFGKQFSSLIDEFNDSLIEFDPQSATQVEIDRLRSKLEEIARLFVSATTQLEKENTALAALQSNIDKNLKALEILSKRAENSIDGSEEKNHIVEQATTINQTIDELEASLPLKQQEVAYAAEYHSTVQKLLNDSEAKLKEAVRVRSKVEHELKMAQIQKDNAKEKLEQARNLESFSGELNADRGVFARASNVAQKRLDEAKAMDLAADRLNHIGNVTGKNLADQILAEDSSVTETPKDLFARVRK